MSTLFGNFLFNILYCMFITLNSVLSPYQHHILFLTIFFPDDLSLSSSSSLPCASHVLTLSPKSSALASALVVACFCCC